MTRYFFHIKREDETIVDEEGSEHDSIEAVRQEAVQSLRELKKEFNFAEQDYRVQWTIVVTAEDGSVVLEYPLAPEAKNGGSSL